MVTNSKDQNKCRQASSKATTPTLDDELASCSAVSSLSHRLCRKFCRTERKAKKSYFMKAFNIAKFFHSDWTRCLCCFNSGSGETFSSILLAGTGKAMEGNVCNYLRYRPIRSRELLLLSLESMSSSVDTFNFLAWFEYLATTFAFLLSVCCVVNALLLVRLEQFSGNCTLRMWNRPLNRMKNTFTVDVMYHINIGISQFVRPHDQTSVPHILESSYHITKLTAQRCPS